MKRGLLILLMLALLLPVCTGAALAAGGDYTKAKTVYFTLSSDGVPLMGSDGTVLSHIKVTVPYFDLAEYGLQDFYRYPSAIRSSRVRRCCTCICTCWKNTTRAWTTANAAGAI